MGIIKKISSLQAMAKITCCMLVLVVSFSSCNTSKRALKDKPDLPTSTTGKDAIYDMLSAKPEIQSMDISKLSINIRTGERQLNVKGFVKMQRDSVILISIQPLPGIEVARAQITPDSITILDRFNSQYYVVSPAQLYSKTGIYFDFNTLQSLFFNELSVPNIKKSEQTKEMFKISTFPPDNYEVKAIKNTLYYDYTFIVNQQAQLTQALLMDKKNPYLLTCDYSNFSKTGIFDFPSNISMTVTEDRHTHRVGFVINKVDINVPVNVSFSVPAKYKKVDIENFNF